MYSRLSSLFFATIIALCMACDSSQTPAPEQEEEPLLGGQREVVPELVMPDPHWIESRVEDAEERLMANEAGQRVWESIEAHGGLANYYAAGPLHFRFNYAPLEGDARDTYQIVDTWSSRVVQWPAGNEEQTFGFDGDNAWETTDHGELGYNARFWSLTPYYFIALPFVLADPGVVLEDLGQASLDGQDYYVVKATFEPGTGDAPDDYYVLYIHHEEHRVDAIRYVVGYPGYTAEGEHGPERFMTYENHQDVEGLLFATHHRTFASQEHPIFDEELHAQGEWGAHITTTDSTEIELRPEITTDYFAIPEGARIIEGWE